MYHSIYFGTGTVGANGFPNGANTWTTWHLIPSSRPSVVPPGVSANSVQIPGRNGSIDMTEYLSGGVTYGDRSGSWDFLVDNDHEYWVTIKNNITNFLHGKRMSCMLEDDPTRVYTGRFSVGEWKSDATCSSITISYVLEPFPVTRTVT